jgi:hypothetical protein
MTASSAQLELAAEQTIAAAAAALLWAGQDSCDVLEHVAGASAARMVGARCAYALFRAARREVAAEDQQAFDEDLCNWVVAGSFEIAALPAPAAPQWAEAVRAAMWEAVDDNHAITMRRDDPAVRLRALQVFVRSQALTMFSCWGQDPLRLNMIDTGAQMVRSQTLLVTSAQF